MLGYLSMDIICSEKRLFFLERSVRSSPMDCRLVVVGELACLSDLESYTVGGIPPAGPTMAGRSKGRGQTKW